MKKSAIALCVIFSIALSVCAEPVRTAVYAGVGPCSNGYIEWLRLVNDSPELELVLVDAQMIRDGALDGVRVLVLGEGNPVQMKKDLGADGAKRIKEYLRNGGGLISTGDGTALLMDDREKKGGSSERGIGVIPFARSGAKNGYFMPVFFNAKCGATTGIKVGEYPVWYQGGPILYKTNRVIDDAAVEIWATFGDDIQGQKKKHMEMYGNPALVGGVFGKGRIFCFACRPQQFRATHAVVQGAFRYVTGGKEVTFPVRPRRQRALTVAFYSSPVRGVDDAKAVLAIDRLEGTDLFPMSTEDFGFNLLDHADVIVLPDGSEAGYGKAFNENNDKYIADFVARGGKVLGWGEGARHLPGGGEPFDTYEAMLGRIGELSK